MKTAALITLGLLVASGPAWANHWNSRHQPMHHVSYRVSHHRGYQSNYKSEGAERNATADLNRQYRGQSVER